MTLSIFDLFSVGIGPSSSHTVGPMRAAASFTSSLVEGGVLDRVEGVRVDLFGSLAATGVGHGTPSAVLLGLEGLRPETVTPAQMDEGRARIATTSTTLLGGRRPIPLCEADVVMRPLTVLPQHTNAVRLTAFGGDGAVLVEETYYSVGGGFVEREQDGGAGGAGGALGVAPTAVPFPFRTAGELLGHCRASGLSFAGVMLANEVALAGGGDAAAGDTAADDAAAGVRARLLAIRDVMDECVETSLGRTGVLPGGLAVRRRAPEWRERLRVEDPHGAPEFWQEWVNLVALAVNEENASGGRVVTAPTNGAAGIVPAVLHYARTYLPHHLPPGATVPVPVTSDDDVCVRFLLAAAAVGVLYKEQASISGAEVGCQGEVGSASSMAAAGLAEVMGGTPEQVENAAEIAMEHNLGLTCDPIGGLVQIPCIERNAIAASKAINAAKMALWGDGSHHVSLDQVIATMRETGRDMSDKYKETALGGLAVNVVEC
ncbi:L-serine ammonia-lyase [Herbiconiux sp. CPCC 205763]|uniref:L-serine ammonia-lyase n=1 Tax=Herbiconiux aconitum TaxID=2970913 RepID=A0ABT2GKE3_9MICO|nr:L-serine ammonia-lyase [Herbiconiux aconitum]MCS5716699.1 L-serine ammonia-lyase [Herbiconiux aconitum]